MPAVLSPADSVERRPFVFHIEFHRGFAFIRLTENRVSSYNIYISPPRPWFYEADESNELSNCSQPALSLWFRIDFWTG
jgi:hypothetical protein